MKLVSFKLLMKLLSIQMQKMLYKTKHNTIKFLNYYLVNQYQECLIQKLFNLHLNFLRNYMTLIHNCIPN